MGMPLGMPLETGYGIVMGIMVLHSLTHVSVAVMYMAIVSVSIISPTGGTQQSLYDLCIQARRAVACFVVFLAGASCTPR
eukprot:8191779-Karenia_brevis.AAC.1